MYYTYLGRSVDGKYKYQFTLNLYRDCYSTGAPLDDNAAIGIFLKGICKRFGVIEFYRNFSSIPKSTIIHWSILYFNSREGGKAFIIKLHRIL